MRNDYALLEKEILKILKVNYLNSLSEIKKDTVPFIADVLNLFSQDKIKEPHKYFYYLYALNDNLFEPMKARAYKNYCDGSGSELEFKMKALRSSSAMTYNLFGNCDLVEINGSKILSSGNFRVEFEKKLPTLYRGGSANLDAFLTKEDGTEIIACEMKMCEWLFNEPVYMNEAYIGEDYKNPQNKINRYFNKDTSNMFIDIAKQLLKGEDDYKITNGTKAYTPKAVQYDAIQIFRHILGCYNYCCKEENKSVKKLTLINCVWNLKNSNSIGNDYLRNLYSEKEVSELTEFQTIFDKEMIDKIAMMFKTINPDFEFDIKFIYFYDFSNMISYPKEKNDKHLRHKAYIDKRYNF